MYKVPVSAKWLGCVVPAAVLVGLVIWTFSGFGDARSDQTADECERKMLSPIMKKVARLPVDAELIEKDAKIEHVLHGNAEDIQPLRRGLVAAGWRIEEWGSEVGDSFKIVDDPVAFRRNAPERLREICELAATHHVQYESWWINAPQIADYVYQN